MSVCDGRTVTHTPLQVAEHVQALTCAPAQVQDGPHIVLQPQTPPQGAYTTQIYSIGHEGTSTHALDPIQSIESMQICVYHNFEYRYILTIDKGIPMMAPLLNQSKREDAPKR